MQNEYTLRKTRKPTSLSTLNMLSVNTREGINREGNTEKLEQMATQMKVQEVPLDWIYSTKPSTGHFTAFRPDMPKGCKVSGLVVLSSK